VIGREVGSRGVASSGADFSATLSRYPSRPVADFLRTRPPTRTIIRAFSDAQQLLRGPARAQQRVGNERPGSITGPNEEERVFGGR
jgi:hypothetical protein